MNTIPLVVTGDDLFSLIKESLYASDLSLKTGDILVIAQKIVSKAEGRLVSLAEVQPTPYACELAEQVNKDPRLVQLVLDESNAVLRFRRDVLIVEHRLGFVMANAGIDMSNVEQGAEDDTALLLPKDPDASARALRHGLQDAFGVDIGVVINDSHGRAWRNGTVGVAIGAAGLEPVRDMRGMPDIFGRQLMSTEIGIADEVAAAASLVMGQAAEATPAVILRGLTWRSRDDATARELIRPRQFDLFR